MHLDRSSGLLLHVTSLPSRFGLGDLGPAAYRFADFLAASGQTLWQVLPLVPPGHGHSPYSSPSTFALSPLLISPERLVDEGLLDAADLDGAPTFDEDRVDWRAAVPFRMALLEKAFTRFDADAASPWHARLDTFTRTHADWLDGYALFATLSEAHAGASWVEWPAEERDRDPATMAAVRGTPAYRKHTFWQGVAQMQWDALRDYLHARRIRTFGDLPIYVADNSADVWAERALFKLNADGRPLAVSGVPPDLFTPVGQHWGNPLYYWFQPPVSDWMPPDELRGVYAHAPAAHAAHVAYNWVASVQDRVARAPLNPHAVDWWARRMRRVLEMVDVVRLDHFRGFAGYWEVPAGAPDARSGYWMPGPGRALFDALRERLGALPVVAEDLGIITPDVYALMDAGDFPGMRVLQFGFSGDAANTHHPANYPANSVAYSGTHDNQTLGGWIETSPAHEVEQVRRDTGTDAGPRALAAFLMHNRAALVVLPVQDVLGLDGEARMNTPGESGGQWGWRLREDALTEATAAWLRDLTERTGRL